MGGIQERLNKLKPYVKGIRFVNTTSVVDVQLKENWVIKENDKILVKKGRSEENYFMFYSEEPTITFDDILDHIEKTINLNIENEKKLELIKIKIEELKKHFETKPLNVLKTLKFQFDELVTTTFVDDTVNNEITKETHN